jgi:hypothetical protein
MCYRPGNLWRFDYPTCPDRIADPDNLKDEGSSGASGRINRAAPKVFIFIIKLILS